jgi:hypothetical protein
MNTDQHAELYGKLRAALLSRHFALRPFFRTNLFNEGNQLETYNGSEWLAGQPDDVQQIERWKIMDIVLGQANPLLFGSHLMTCLAVEHLMGRSDALMILKLLVQTLGSLYKFAGKPEFQGKHFDGYILRYDAVSNGGWYLEEKDGRVTKRYSLAFPIGQDGQYIYSTPLNDPRYMRPLPGNYEPYARDTFKGLCRAAEASMDEHVGLITGYFIVFHLLENDTRPEAQALRREIARQAGNLADYLAEFGYILVRPAGGVSGHAVLIEFPAIRVFQRLTGKPLAELQSRVNFVGAMEKAGVWKCLEIPFMAVTAGVGALDLVLMPILAPLSIPLAFITSQVLNIGVEAARAGVLSACNICFDVWAENYANEFAGAYLAKLLEPPMRLVGWFAGLERFSEGSASAFPLYLGLTGLDDPDATVRDAYLRWLPARRASKLDDGKARASSSLFASAVGVVLGAGAGEEQTLAKALSAAHDDLHGEPKDVARGDKVFRFGRDRLPLRNNIDGFGRTETHEDSMIAADYMSAVALAWLHANRQADKGTPVTTPGFPKLPNPALWPNASVPNGVIASAAVTLPRNAIQNRSPLVQDAEGANLFLDPVAKSPEPTPIPPPASTNVKFDARVTVREADGDVFAGVIVRNGDTLTIDEVTGQIWAGVALTGTNGPRGWEDRVEHDVKFPYHGFSDSHPYCLLAKLKNYIFVGDGLRPLRYFADPHINPDPAAQVEPRLYLRINDDTPGNGNGEFACRVRVFGNPEPHLTVTTEPAAIPFDCPVDVTVHVQNPDTQEAVGGTVVIDNRAAGHVDVPFRYTFGVRKIVDPETRQPVDEQPTGRVVMPNYLDAEIPFAFYTSNAAFVRQTVPATMITGRSYSVSVTMRNTGTGTWTPGDAHPFLLGSQSPQDNMIWGTNRRQLMGPVAPGSEATFDFTVVAPAAGTYHFQWRIVQEGLQWFGAPSPDVSVSVTPATPLPKQVVVSASPSTITVDRLTTLTVSSKDANTGALVAGRVWIDSVDTAASNQAFKYTFIGGEKMTVRAPGYVEAAVKIQFSVGTRS